MLGWNCIKCLKVSKIVTRMKFTVVWRNLEQNNCLQRQPFTKCLRQTLFFMWNRALREKFNFFFLSSFLLILAKYLFCEKNLALWNFRIFLIFPNFQNPKSHVVQYLVRQLVYTNFITNNHTSFLLLWKEN